MEDKDPFFSSHSASLQASENCSCSCSRISVQKKTQSISELKCPIPRGSSSALVEVIVTVLYGVVNIEQMHSTISIEYICAG